MNDIEQEISYERDMTRLQEIIVRVESIKLLYMIQTTGGSMGQFPDDKTVDIPQRIADEYKILLRAVCAFGGIEIVSLE